MNAFNRASQSGFVLIGLFILLVIIAVVVALAISCANLSASGVKPATTTNPAADTARAIGETARAGTALAHMADQPDAADATIATPSAIPVDSTAPDAGESLGDILEDILDAL